MPCRTIASRLLMPCVVAALLTATAVGQTRHPVSTFKHRSVDAAWQASQESKRPLLLFLHADNCRYCVKMQRETLSHPKIAPALAASAETVAIRKEDHPELVKRLGVRAYPTTVVISPEGKEVGRLVGFLTPQKFASAMFGPAKADRTAQQPTQPTQPRR